MRNTFAEYITEQAGRDERVAVLSGDIGNRLFDKFKKQYPGRFFNCGVAEANMVSLAAGMALDGLRPFLYTITPFLTARCYEQIKLDLCYHDLPVTLVGTGSGLSYAELGPTHHSIEDVAILRALPRMGILCPADGMELKDCMEDALRQQHPLYIRIGKKGEPLLHEARPGVGLAKSCCLRTGEDVAILAAGPILKEALAAAEALSQREGVKAAVYSTPSVKPLDVALLNQISRGHKLIATVEEHSLIGGLGAAIAEWKADQAQVLPPLLRLGLEDQFYEFGGGHKEALSVCNLAAGGIFRRILEKFLSMKNIDKRGFK